MSTSLTETHNTNTGKFALTATGHEVSKVESVPNLKQREHIVQVLPRNQVQTTLLQNGTTDLQFDIPSDALDFLDQTFITYTVANADGANIATLVDGFSSIEYITLWCNDQEVQRLDGFSLRNNYLVSKDTQKNFSALAGAGISPTTFASSLTVAAAGSTNVYIPINCIIDRAEIPLWRKESRWRMTIRHLVGAQLIVAGAAVIADQTIVAGSYKLWLTGRLLDEKVKQLHDYHLETGGPKTYRYLNQSRTDLALGNITSGTAVTVNFTQQGRICFLYLHVQPAAGVGAALYSSSAVTSFDVLNNSRPIYQDLGDNNYLTAFLKSHAPNHWENTSLFSLLNVYYASFSDKPQQGLEHGANHGSFRSSGSTETIRIIPGANAAAASLKVYALMYSHLDIDYVNKTFEINRNSA